MGEFLADALTAKIFSMSHRGQDFSYLYQDTARSLRTLMDIPSDYHIWFVGSATEAMERTIQNLAQHRSHHLIVGAFSAKFAGIACQLGVKVSADEVSWGTAMDVGSINIPDDVELIAVTQNETSTGLAIPPGQITRLHERYPNKLIAVDIVSSAPYVNLDFQAADVAFFSVQKCFGLPPGLGVMIVSPRALDRAKFIVEAGQSVGSYHSFPSLASAEVKLQTPETPNVLAIYLLGRVCEHMIERGIGTIRSGIREHASRMYSYFDNNPLFAPLVLDPAYRSQTVIVVACTLGSRAVIDRLSNYGIHLGHGYGQQKDSHVRIANFPAHAEHIDNLLTLLDRLVARR